MIIAPTAAYYMVKAEGEAAENMVSELSPSTASDIATVILVSADFEVDIMAVHNLSRSIEYIKGSLHDPKMSVDEKYNPLYMPAPMEQVDEMLNLDPRNDGIRFVGMNGNPYTLKTVEMKANGDEPLVTGKVDYRPFDFPGYSEIVADRERAYVN